MDPNPRKQPERAVRGKRYTPTLIEKPPRMKKKTKSHSTRGMKTKIAWKWAAG